jgi:hypothetical protein
MEKIQVTGFFLQETIISGLYIFETRRLLKPAQTFQKDQIRRVMSHLIYINIFIIILDIIVLVTEYAGLFDIQVTFKGAVYSVKLRMEFAVLNELMRVASGGARSKSVEWLSSYGNGTNRGEVALDTFDSTGGRGGGASKTGGTDGLGYSYSAGKGASSQYPTTTDSDKSSVVKTTEVVVNSSNRGVTQTQYPVPEIDDGEFQGQRRVGHRGHGTTNLHRISPASSEVGFAGRGF